MDWSKAKSMMIAILLVINLAIGGMYVSGIVSENRAIAAETKSAIEYAEGKGVRINCPVPGGSKKVNVISVEFAGGAGESPKSYKGIKIELLGVSGQEHIEKIEKTGSRINTLPAYTAILKSLGSVTGSIDGLELIYLVDRTSYSGMAGKDTALPYWKLVSGNNFYYYAAYSN
jgi:hypothetical protein